MRKICFLSIILVLISCRSGASESVENIYLSISAFNESNGEHAGLEISGLSNINNHFAGRISGVIFEEENEAKINEIYEGYSATGYFHFGQKYLNPYFGAGIFVGETFSCNDTEKEAGTCKEDNVLAAYPEIGLAINIKAIHIFPFVRHYFDTNNHRSSVSAYGLYIGINIK